MTRTWTGGAVAAAALALTMGGCSTTQQVKVSDKASSYCPFLGPDVCAKLKATDTPGRLSEAAVTGGGDGVLALRYINPDARWTQYKKVMIAPVSFWAGDDTSVSKADQITLTNYFSQALNDAFRRSSRS